MAATCVVRGIEKEGGAVLSGEEWAMTSRITSWVE